jgi:hypothetical protein
MSPVRPRTPTPSQRADQVRQRRATRTQTRQEKTTRNLTAAPSVTVRGAGMGKPMLQRTAVRPRRVYTVAVENAGRAYSIPAPTIRFGWRALSALVVAGLVALLVFMFNSSTFKVEKPSIVGATRLSANDIEAVLKFNGRSIFSIDPGQATADLVKTYPEMQGISIAVGLPNKVSVKFDERQPVLAWKQKDMVSWVDSSGMVFAARGAAPDNLITVTSSEALPLYQIVPTPGPTPTPVSTEQAANEQATQQAAAKAAPNKMDLSILTSALLLNKQMPAKGNLIFAQKEGLGWHDPNGWDVYFGKTLDDLEMKISMYQAMVTQLKQKNLKAKYFNLENLHAPFYRLEP